MLIALILATTLFLNAHKPDSDDDSDTEPINALSEVNASYSAVKSAASKRSYDEHIAKVIEVKQAEEAERHRKAREEAERARKAKAIAQTTPSRSSSYVGQPQKYEATFYTAFCPTGCTGVTASGYDVSNTIYYDGMRILAAPKHVPFYSIMRVTLADGSTFDGIVLDRGGDIKTGRLDILVKSRDEAYKLGRQTVTVRMIRKGR